MKALLASLLLAAPLGAMAQDYEPLISTEAAAHTPVIGLRAGFATGRCRPDRNPARMKAQAGWEAALVVGQNPRRQGGLQLEAAFNCLRFSAPLTDPGGASYRWITFQPALLGFVRVTRGVHVLGGAGVMGCLSCWRWLLHPVPGSYGYRGDYSGNKTSRPGTFFGLLGLRGEITPYWYVEGRYGRSLTSGQVTSNDHYLLGPSAWSSISIGYWLNPRPVPATP